MLEFAFDSRESSGYLPHTYARNCVCYVGTHDNETVMQWREKADAADITYARKYLGLSEADYEAVQLPLNMMDTKNILCGGLEKLKKADVIVFIRSVFLQGLFFRDPQTLPEGVLQLAKEPLKKLNKLAEEENRSIAEIALTFIRDLDGVTSLVLGSETPEQVKENISLVNAPGISEATRSRILEIFSDIDERVLMPWTWNK